MPSTHASIAASRPRIIAVDGSYRRGGITDQLVDKVLAEAAAAGAATERLDLIDQPIGFCRNCRACATAPLQTAPVRASCEPEDGLAALLDRLDAADGLVLAAPVQFGTVTAVMKRFMERLICYAYWPWGQPAPQLRRDLSQGKYRRRRPAVLITSSAAPSLLGRLLAGSPLKELQQAAEALGCKPVGKLWHGLSAQQPDQRIHARAARRAERLGQRLAATARHL
jgi:putative NADPH-quinone reductase